MAPYTADTTAEEIAADCQSQIAGKTILITGVTPGSLGGAFATTIAKSGPACIILATRDITKAEQTAQDIAVVSPDVRTHAVQLDLGSITRVRAAAVAIDLLEEKIDVIVNNAGIMAPPFEVTEDDIERQFATNHIGHFLLTNLLLPKMLSRKVPVRVVNVSSNGFRFSPVRCEDWNFDGGKTYNRWVAYAQSKTATMLFSVSLARKLKDRGVVSVSLHPGIISTNLSKEFTPEDFYELGPLDRQLGYRSMWTTQTQFKSLSQGVATHVFAAFHPSLESPELNGSYLLDSQVESPERVLSWARDPVDAEKLWSLSEELVSQRFSY